MQQRARWVESAYDDIASGYDERWSVHIRAPQEQLTQALALRSGMRCADLGCGTGIDTLAMARQVTPEKVYAVDCSEKMLEEASLRAQAEGLGLRTVCTDAESFIAHAEPASFDVLSLRFCLAYLEWRSIAPALARALRPGGRLGILTNLGTSTPQALEIYREMVRDLGVLEVALPVPLATEDLTVELERGGFRVEHCFSHGFKLWFDSGSELADWLAASGFITHAALSSAPEIVRRMLWETFATRIERFREASGIPLDFELAGVIAVRT